MSSGCHDTAATSPKRFTTDFLNFLYSCGTKRVKFLNVLFCLPFDALQAPPLPYRSASLRRYPLHIYTPLSSVNSFVSSSPHPSLHFTRVVLPTTKLYLGAPLFSLWQTFRVIWHFYFFAVVCLPSKRDPTVMSFMDYFLPSIRHKGHNRITTPLNSPRYAALRSASIGSGRPIGVSIHEYVRCLLLARLMH
jgi:hypothetical protein